MSEPLDSSEPVHPALRITLWAALGYVLLSQLLQRLDGYVPNDLGMYHRAARWWADGRHPYSEAFRQAGGDTLPFVYPPGTLPLFRPLAGLSLETASVVWFVGGVGLALGSLVYFARRYTPETPTVLAAGLVFAYFPLYFALTHGNVAILLCAATLLAHLSVTSERGPRDLAAGAVLGVCIALKPYWLLPFGFLLVAARSWRALAGLAAGLGAVALATCWHGDLVGEWLAMTGSVDRLSTSLLPTPWWLAATGLLVVAWLALGAWWVRRRSPAPDELFVFATTSVVVWPRVGAYSYLVVLPALLWLAGRRDWRLAGLLLLPASSPAIWLVARYGGGLSARLWLYGWAVVCAGIVVWELRNRSTSRRPSTPPPGDESAA